jgi:hypothetical protein
MRRATTVVVLLLGAILAAAAYLTLRGFGLAGSLRPGGVRPLHPGDQEVAWIGPATSGDAWERLVAAVRSIQEQWSKRHPELPPLGVELEHVFTERTTDVPELALRLGGRGHPALWIRWYKTSSEIEAPAWLEQLAERDPPPIAILGGENSERALSLGRLLAECQQSWRGPAPLFLITTATADRYARETDASEAPLTAPSAPKLMHVYKDRSFRFSFTNSRMATVVMAFIRDHPEVWALSPSTVTLRAGAVAVANAPSCLAFLVSNDVLPPVYLYAVAWADDPYSKDLADRFGEVFQKRLEQQGVQPRPAAAGAERVMSDLVSYGVGDRDRPNPAEAHAIDNFFEDNPLLRGSRELLVLPTGTERARRFLRTVVNQAPQQMSNLVVLSGDSITFNNVFRDRDAAWNVQDMPVPLVFFSHRNPISKTAGFRPLPAGADPSAPTGTQDLLLYRDIVEALVQACAADPDMLGTSDQTRAGMRQLRWHDGRVRRGAKGVLFFNEDGDRSAGTGEHVVWLQPEQKNGRVLAQAVIRVWGVGPAPQDHPRWQRAGDPLKVLYDWPARTGGQ